LQQPLQKTLKIQASTKFLGRNVNVSRHQAPAPFMESAAAPGGDGASLGLEGWRLKFFWNCQAPRMTVAEMCFTPGREDATLDQCDLILAFSLQPSARSL
jgi:hypothetical protein